MNEGDKLADVIIDAVRRHALSPLWRQATTAYPLHAMGGENTASDWWKTDNAHGKRREGHPVITVKHNNSWAASVITSPTGKNTTVYVPKGTKVIEVQETR